MLVLTRRVSEKIIFPEIDVTVELMSISGNRARLGVKAPQDLRVLREEIAKAGITPSPHGDRSQPGSRPGRPDSREARHALLNRLNAVRLAAELLKLQLANGQHAESHLTLGKLRNELIELTDQFKSRSSIQQPAPPEPDRGRRALLVEDDANESRLLAGFLRMTGFEVATAGDGADALNYLSQNTRPDVVLLDMLMPRCDGPSTLTAIRGNPALDGMKVFAVSGTSPASMGIEIGPNGIDRWFDKPIDPEELVQVMSRELARN